MIQRTVENGLTSGSLIVMLASLIGAGIGAFLASYLKKRGELLATKGHFEELLRQLKAQTEATETVKREIELGGKIDVKLLEYSQL